MPVVQPWLVEKQQGGPEGPPSSQVLSSFCEIKWHNILPVGHTDTQNPCETPTLALITGDKINVSLRGYNLVCQHLA